MYEKYLSYVIILTSNQSGDLMPKIKVEISLETSNIKENYQTNAYLKENIITYYEKNHNKTKTTYNYKDNLLIRNNEEIFLKYKFNLKEPTIGSLKVNKLNKVIDIPIKTKLLQTKNENVNIIFEIPENTIKYKIEVIK